MRSTRLIVSSLLLFGAAVPLAGQSWSTLLENMLNTARETYAEAGYKTVVEAQTGSLDERSLEDVWLDLSAARDYVLVGVCDADCSDMDLEVYDMAGREIDSDLELDDVPIEEISPEASGSFRISVGMVTCSVEPCSYGFAILERAARPPSEWEQTVVDQLDAFSDRMSEQAYRPTHGYRTGSLDQGESSTFIVRLKAGTAYGVGGFCDGDCSDLDLTVLAGKEVVVQDVQIDDYPAVDFNVTKSGIFNIRVSMPGCSSEPCYWGVSIQGKPAGKP